MNIPICDFCTEVIDSESIIHEEGFNTPTVMKCEDEDCDECDNAEFVGLYHIEHCCIECARKIDAFLESIMVAHENFEVVSQRIKTE